MTTMLTFNDHYTQRMYSMHDTNHVYRRICILGFQERMDKLHDETMSLIWGRPFSLEEDVRLHKELSEQKAKKPMTLEALSIFH